MLATLLEVEEGDIYCSCRRLPSVSGSGKGADVAATVSVPKVIDKRLRFMCDVSG